MWKGGKLEGSLGSLDHVGFTGQISVNQANQACHAFQLNQADISCSVRNCASMLRVLCMLCRLRVPQRFVASAQVDTALGPEGAEAGHTAEGAAKLSCAAEHKDGLS